jgi:hypothetical protein
MGIDTRTVSSGQNCRIGTFKHRSKLTPYNIQSLPGLALFQRFANTDYWRRTRSHGSTKLGCDLRIIFTKQCATFRMSQDNVLDTELGEHR